MLYYCIALKRVCTSNADPKHGKLQLWDESQTALKTCRDGNRERASALRTIHQLRSPRRENNCFAIVSAEQKEFEILQMCGNFSTGRDACVSVQPNANET